MAQGVRPGPSEDCQGDAHRRGSWEAGRDLQPAECRGAWPGRRGCSGDLTLRPQGAGYPLSRVNGLGSPWEGDLRFQLTCSQGGAERRQVSVSNVEC